MFIDIPIIFLLTFPNIFRYLDKVFSLIFIFKMPKETKGPQKNERSKYENTQQTETYRQ